MGSALHNPASEPPLVMTRAQLEALPHYQSTNPTQPKLGKRWRRCWRRYSRALKKPVAWIWYVAEVISVDEKYITWKWNVVDLLDAHPVDIDGHAW